MGFFVSALLTLATADGALPAQAVHHGGLAEGWARSWFVASDMNWNQVNAVLGQRPDRIVGGLGGSATCDYTRLGVLVVWEPDGKTVVSWEYRPFRR